MDILKLSAEMDLNCIKAYKLDALKSVRKTDEGRSLGMGHHSSEVIETVAEDSDHCHATVDGTGTNACEYISTTTILQSGKDHIHVFLFFLHYFNLCIVVPELC
jgi:methyltransferase NSUN6